jgi:hypothetical protein
MIGVTVGTLVVANGLTRALCELFVKRRVVWAATYMVSEQAK